MREELKRLPGAFNEIAARIAIRRRVCARLPF
jgi:hypothetical protein